jgi:chitin biosynthesis protein CHS5
MVEVSLTVGKLDASLALLLTKDHHLIEFPTILLPDGISAGSIVKLTCERDLVQEKAEREKFEQLQEEIYEIFGKHEPEPPIMKVVNITQTSCVLEWEPLNLGTAELRELTLYKNGTKLGPIKNPFQKKNIKFSGLPIDTPYKFQLKLETSAGIYYSNLLELRTHKMTDLSGITVCIGDIDFNEEKFSLEDIEKAIEVIGAKPYSNVVKVDTTQFICTRDTGIEYQKAKNMNIPIIRPEWLKACQLERRIVGVNKFYLNTENPIWKTKDFWLVDNDVPRISEIPKEDKTVPVPEEHEQPDQDQTEQTEKPEVQTSAPDVNNGNVPDIVISEDGHEEKEIAESVEDEQHIPEQIDNDLAEEVVEEASQTVEEVEAAPILSETVVEKTPEVEKEEETIATTTPTPAAETISDDVSVTAGVSEVVEIENVGAIVTPNEEESIEEPVTELENVAEVDADAKIENETEPTTMEQATQETVVEDDFVAPAPVSNEKENEQVNDEDNDNDNENDNDKEDGDAEAESENADVKPKGKSKNKKKKKGKK